MDEQKRIDECNKIADIIPSVLEIEDEEDFYISRLKRCMIALYLLDAGYGDVKQALEDYATKLHNNIVVYLKRDFDTREEVCKIIDETLKEVCGE